MAVPVEIVIARDGRVEAARVLKAAAGVNEAAAVEALERSRFEPARLFGVAVPVICNVRVDIGEGRGFITAS